MLVLERKNVLLQLDAPSKEEVIRALCGILEKNGHVSAEYCEDVLNRERQYPTGLPTEGVPVAIPHGMKTDAVISPAVAVATLREPVAFRNMVAPDEDLPVRVVCLIANRNPEAQLKDLRQLMSCLGSGELLCKILESAEEQEVVRLILGYREED